MRERERQLEREVEERTRELVALSTHLQSVAEREKASLARELHDELGGLLVGARMDISWAEQHLAAGDIDMKQRLNRVQQNLSAGIDLKRRIIEELRPTLLDNVGFIAALRWQFKETCARAGLNCTEYFPDEEPKFTSDAGHRAVSHRAGSVRQHHQALGREVGDAIALDIDDDNGRVWHHGRWQGNLRCRLRERRAGLGLHAAPSSCARWNLRRDQFPDRRNGASRANSCFQGAAIDGEAGAHSWIRPEPFRGCEHAMPTDDSAANEPSWLTIGRELRAIAQTGLAFSRDPFDRQRYERIRELAASLIAHGRADETRAACSSHSVQRPDTRRPKVDVRAAAFATAECSWSARSAMAPGRCPGGWADVNESAAECVVREVAEESGYQARAVKARRGLRLPQAQPASPPRFHLQDVLYL